MCNGNYYCKIGRNVIINKKIRWKSSFVLRSFKDEKKNIRKKEFERGDYPEFQHPL